MIKNLIAAIVLMLLVIGSPTITNAQQETQDGTYNQAPAINNSSQTGAATDDTDDGFNWMWLLPLLAFPLIFLFKQDKKKKDSGNYQNENFAGSKGGKAKRNRDDDL